MADRWVLRPDWPVVSFSDAQTMVGRQVRVLLGETEDGGLKVVTGRLMRLTAEGDFDIDTSDGMRYCWPWLSVQEEPAPGDYKGVPQ